MSSLLFLSLLYVSFVIKRKGCLYLENVQSIFWKSVIMLSGLFSAFAGIDRGESIYGLLRLITYLIAGLAIQQMEEKHKRFILQTIPVMGIIFSVCSLFHGFKIFQYWISLPSGRLAGPFEYPNTMALFLLIGLIFTEHFWKRRKYVVQLLLIAGVFATGSRTVFIVLCGYLLYCFMKSGGKNKALIIFMATAGSIICFTMVFGQALSGLGRFINIDINASTFQGRLLYWEDAVKMLLKHPFGLGYMGYFYLQQAEQTGVYSVRFVHNEWLQCLLDYGILAGFGVAMYIAGQFKIKKMGNMERELLSMIGICSFFDFHLQFTSIVLIILLLFPKGDVICSGRWLLKWKSVFSLGVVLSAWLVIANTVAQQFAYYEDYKNAAKWNPLRAQYKQELLLQSEDLKSAADFADELLEGNQYLYAAYLIKSNKAAQEGRVDIFIENRKQVLKLRKYKMNEYEDYFQILLSWYSKACAENNDEVMNQCKKAMKEIPEIIMEVKRQTSVRAYRIRQKPELNFNKEYEKIIQAL